MPMKVTILGSGTSVGVPSVGCKCKVCTSTDARDNRLRCSAMIEVDGVRILMDCGPDFRQQMINVNDYRSIDAVLITHEHYDHVGGIDDLRPFCVFGDIPVYADNFCGTHLKERIPYCFGESLYPGVPHISLQIIDPYKPIMVCAKNGSRVEVVPITVMHGKLPIMGYRISEMAWITDMLTMPDESFNSLKGVKVLFMNALRFKEHPTHQNLTQALEQAERIGAEQVYFIHMSHEIGLHAETESLLPAHCHLAYDGLTVEF